ncbi:cob(I)yrinic acid a,c-diamide adenosyltransferase [Shouchella lehensis]|uniref:Corrinoid adenosyltransferase n=1 Tax=Shouchella lehensis TaxID=300825 RepID=A0A4Y7WQ50_9BACI|nr:cob(I)yrinic acid a,c-diamide adenosyltransferase [Shouchella lehensis]MBG9784463.1 hypothetical protein [Shouchella lehensis]TES50531.1 cob(I)yrinic acid a,c-diamide adenosyltransferase [Shouchella lehensis]
MKIYTRGGDKGKTSVLGGRLNKTDNRIEAIGAVDELNSVIGQAIYCAHQEHLSNISTELMIVSNQLFDYGTDLANVKETIPYKITAAHTEELEQRIDAHTESMEPLEYFILPGGCATACALHVCRTEARKAERRVNQLESGIHPELQVYINRLSDYLFTLARLANKQTGVVDVAYEGEKHFDS